MAGTNRRKVLIRGLEPGSAYLAYLLRGSGFEVYIYTTSPATPYIDVPPFEPLFTFDFLREALAVRFVESLEGDYDLVVDSCDVLNFEEVRKALSSGRPAHIVGDKWLSASLSLYQSLPIPDVGIDLPLERTKQFGEVAVEYRRYTGGRYSICGEFKDSWGDCPYVPLRSFERIFAAVDIYSSIMGVEAPRKKLKLEYAVGKDKAYVSFGCRPEGKASKINLGDVQVWLYGEEGRPKYAFIQGRPEHLPWIFSMYNLARTTDFAFLYDFGPYRRGAFNFAYIGHLFRGRR